MLLHQLNKLLKDATPLINRSLNVTIPAAKQLNIATPDNVITVKLSRNFS